MGVIAQILDNVRGFNPISNRLKVILLSMEVKLEIIFITVGSEENL
ncbi:hypothetical protein [Methanobrevibacter sp.]